MIRIRTNLDMAKTGNWPELDHVPQIGSLVYNSRGLETRVESITYKIDKAYSYLTNVDVWVGLPYPSVEGVTEWEKRMKGVLTYQCNVVEYI